VTHSHKDSDTNIVKVKV